MQTNDLIKPNAVVNLHPVEGRIENPVTLVTVDALGVSYLTELALNSGAADLAVSFIPWHAVDRLNLHVRSTKIERLGVSL